MDVLIFIFFGEHSKVSESEQGVPCVCRLQGSPLLQTPRCRGYALLHLLSLPQPIVEMGLGPRLGLTLWRTEDCAVFLEALMHSGFQ